MIEKGGAFPNLFLLRPDGTSFELMDLRRRKHALVLLLSPPAPEARALIGLIQDRAKLFRWLDLEVAASFPNPRAVFTPWPAPDFPPCLHPALVPEGLEWGSGYVVSKNGTLLERYPDLAELSADKVERDLLYWEAGHCLP